MATTARPRARLTKERLFYSGMALMIFAMVFVGFAPTWFMRGAFETARPLKPLAPLVMLHGVLFTAWIALFVTQAGLISARQHKLHMKLGLMTVAVGVAIVAVGLLTAARQAVIGSGPPELAPLTWFTVPFSDMVAFAGLLAGGFAWRRDPQTHKRLMLCATAIMLQPGVGRMEFLPLVLGPETTAILAVLLAAVPLLAWDYAQRGRPHPASLIGVGVLAGQQLVRAAVWESPTWHAIAGWVVRVLT